MGEVTGISWCDHTFNPWIGCTKVSPACDGCYAEAMMGEAGRYKRVQWGAPGKGDGTRVRTSDGYWRQPLRWNRKAEADGTRPFVFCASLADVFDNAVPVQWRRDLFDLIRATPNLTWLLLTKRPGNIVKLFVGTLTGISDPSVPLGQSRWPRNAAIGCTIVTQEEADRDIPKLLAATAGLRPAFAFLSMEPLLGPVDLTEIVLRPFGGRPTELSRQLGDYIRPLTGCFTDSPRIGWVITGGETDQGPHTARPGHPAWERAIRDQCAAAGVPYHRKQWGEWAPQADVPEAWRYERVTVLPDGRVREWEDGYPAVRLIHPDMVAMVRVGKKRAGRLLDGVLHDARPEIRP